MTDEEIKAAEDAAKAAKAAEDAAKAEQAVKDAEAAAKKAAEDQEAEKEVERARLARMTQEERDKDMIANLVKERLEKELAPIKGNLDKAYAARDEALKKVAEFERKERDANLKRLEEEGKHQEAFEIRLSEERAKNADLERRNMELSRDVVVREALRGYAFRSDKAAEMAFKEIITNLIQKDAGVWIHRSGMSVKDYCEAFSKDEEQSFLFKAKTNSGAGTQSTATGAGTGTGKEKKSIFDYSQEEVLKMAAEGKLPTK